MLLQDVGFTDLDSKVIDLYFHRHLIHAVRGPLLPTVQVFAYQLQYLRPARQQQDTTGDVSIRLGHACSLASNLGELASSVS